jgi:broad-specificity NMP kinase
MPRGVPKAGFRTYAKRSPDIEFGSMEPIQMESDDQIAERIQERFECLEELARATITGESRALIVSGPPGLGKSYTVESVLSSKSADDYRIVKGFVRATGLYRLLYEMRHSNCVLVFDDCDSIFFENDTLNLLKAACDTTERRRIHWGAETRMRDDSEDILPTSFDFEGAVVFITNHDFDKMIAHEHKLSEHVAAMVSRAHYIDLTLKTKRDFVIRIKQVINQGMLHDRLSTQQINDCMAFIENHKNNLRELSLRMAIKIATLMKTYPHTWERIARITCLKGQ